MNSFVQGLQLYWTVDDEALIQSLIQEIEVLRSQTLHWDEPQWSRAFEHLAPYRLQSSSSLKRGEIASWVRANQWMVENSQDQAHPAWFDILEINRLLRNVTEAQIRSQEVYLGPWATCPVSELGQALSQFQSEILSSSQFHPLIKAALVQYWLVSLHPFPDGNGRTAVLAADWILTQENYLPQVFESQLSAVIAHVPGRKTQSHSARAVQKVLKNVKLGYELALKSREP